MSTARRLLLVALVLLLAGGAAHASPFTPSDPYYASYEWYAPLMNLPSAWDLSLGSANVIVAVLDTGVLADTPDLAGRLLPPLSATSSPPLDGTANHHGTWVASTVGMTINNGLGGAGVGNFTILPITVTDVFGHNTSSWIATGIRMAADAGARVINVSHSTLSYDLLNDAAAYARTKGALVFVAAGNSDAYNGMLGFDNLIFVSGTDRNDQRWHEVLDATTTPPKTIGSTWGPYVDLSAPSDDILIADPTLAPSGYGIIHGTSFASPLAAGAAALAWSIDPDLTPEQVLNLLYDTAVDLGDPGRDDVYGYGRIDIGAVAAGAYALTPEPATLALLAGGLAALAGGRRRRRG
jgi:subtilisin family serine protease